MSTTKRKRSHVLSLVCSVLFSVGHLSSSFQFHPIQVTNTRNRSFAAFFPKTREIDSRKRSGNLKKAVWLIDPKKSLFGTTSLAVLLTLLASPALAVDGTLWKPLGELDTRFFLAGGICAAFSHGITTPIDVIKTRIQVDPEKYSGGVADAAKIVWKEEGSAALLTGLVPTVLGYGIEGAAKFGLYESLKPAVLRQLDLDNPTIPYLFASVIAGAAASIVLCPLERARIRLVTDPNFASNLLTAIPLLVKESGVRNLFSGFPAMISKQVPYTLGKQVSFDEVAEFLYSVVAMPGDASTRLEVSFVSAFFASIAACLLSQPGDVILTDTYKDKGSTPLKFGHVVSSIFDRSGIGGFYSGLQARILQVGVIITSQLLLYDYVKQALGLPATGSSGL